MKAWTLTSPQQLNLISQQPSALTEQTNVKVKMEQMPTARLVVDAEVYNPDGKLINTGSVTLGFMHSATRRPCRVPEWFMQTLEEYIAKQNA